MKKIIISGLMALTVFFSGCATQALILQAPVMSMKELNAGGAKALKAVGSETTARWCQGDEPVVRSEDDNYGLLDQVLSKFHNATKTSYVMNARLFSHGMGCVVLKGTPANH